MGKEENSYVSEHLKKREEVLSALKKGNELSTTVFNTVTEQEKEKILQGYLKTYEKAIEKVEQLEAEKSKLSSGKKSYEKDEKGEFVSKQTFDEQTVQQLRKTTTALINLHKALDKAMIVGDSEHWDSLAKLVK